KDRDPYGSRLASLRDRGSTWPAPGEEHAESEGEGAEREERDAASGPARVSRGNHLRGGHRSRRGVESLGEIRHAGGAVRRDSREGASDGMSDGWWDRLAHRVERTGDLVEPARDDRLSGRTGERRLAGQHLVEHAREAALIAAGVDLPVAGALLGAHVSGRSDGEASLGQPLASLRHRARDPEVGDEDVAVAGE